MVTIELFGAARLAAKREQFAVEARTVGEALNALVSACPALDAIVCDGQLSRHYAIALNGKHFTTDAARTLRDGDALVIVSAHAGG